jgi:hypothetical protein
MRTLIGDVLADAGFAAIEAGQGPSGLEVTRCQAASRAGGPTGRRTECAS